MINAIVKEAHEMLPALGSENRERMLMSVCAIAADATDPSVSSGDIRLLYKRI